MNREKAKMNKGNHLLCFVTDDEGQLFIHADKGGLDLLIKSLTHIRKSVGEGKSDHDHLMTESWGGQELTETNSCGNEGRILDHVKICGWSKGEQ